MLEQKPKTQTPQVSGVVESLANNAQRYHVGFVCVFLSQMVTDYPRYAMYIMYRLATSLGRVKVQVKGEGSR